VENLNFLTPLRVECVGTKTWKLLENFSWRGSKGDVFTVKAGEITDFATVPWWTQSLIPRTGTWTKAAVLHDKMCDLLNSHYRLSKEYDAFVKEWKGSILESEPPTWALLKPNVPLFNSVDTDAIFYKNARESGTDVLRSEMLWFGVRCGALINPARRGGWLSTFPRFLGDLVAIMGLFCFLIWAVVVVF
jgi:hypothetical protein